METKLSGILVLIIFGLNQMKESMAVIYTINEKNYNLMPPLYAMDDYSSCMLDPDAMYCLTDVKLYSTKGSDLLTMIQEYSDHKIKHFNHTEIHRGVCVTSTCKNFTKDVNNKTLDLKQSLEACLNDSVYKQYELQGSVVNVDHCVKKGEPSKYDRSDMVVAVVYIIIILLNVVGSFYDIFFCQGGEKKGNPYLLAFSLKRNWARLVAPSGGGTEPRLDRLKLFHGLRAMTMICVFFSHSGLIMAYSYIDNPLYIEKSYDDPLKQILFNGSLVTHTFFVMSSFLLAYNFMLHAEKGSISWWQWPKGVLMRWLRLTPVYALILATISTWMRHLGSGPLWGLVVVTEAEACRRYWWAHVLYVNNYVYDDNLCTPQTWYLAADTQLFCLGLLLCVVARTPRARTIALSAMFVLSIVISAAHTYFQGFDAVVLQSPEKYRNLYKTDDTFRLLYVRGHTNLSTYTLGLAGGFIAYHLQTYGKDLDKYKSYRWLLWLIVPLALAIMLSGGLFYSDGKPPSTALRVLYAALYKPAFQTCVVIFILGCVFKVETVCRSIVEWRGFTWMGRVSYSGFFIHTIFQRALMGSQLTPIHMTDLFVMTVLSATIFISFGTATLLWLTVEAPANALTKAVTGNR